MQSVRLKKEGGEREKSARSRERGGIERRGVSRSPPSPVGDKQKGTRWRDAER